MRYAVTIFAATTCLIAGAINSSDQAAGADLSPAVAQNVRPPVDRPNLMIQTSADFISAISAEDIDENDPHFTDNILGTSISGTTHTVGKRTAVLIDSPDRGLMEIQMRGTTTSQTVGLHPPVTIYSSGTTQFTGALRVAMDPEGFIASCPAAWACTHTCINNICICGGRLVQRIATKRVYQSKPEAEGIASQHAQQRVNDRIKSNSVEGLAKQNQGYQDKLIKPLARWGAVPDLHYSSTPATLLITARESAPDQPGAPNTPPEIAGNPMLGLRVHESFINNMTAKTLGGRRISREEFVKGYKDLFLQDPPGEKADEEHDKHWTITFAKEQPVNVHFADNGFSIALNATRFTSTNPDTDIDYPWTISADYKIDGRQAKRIGDIKVEAKGGKPTQRAVDRGKLLHRFENMFKETFEFQGLEFQKVPFSKAGKLVSSQLSSDQGWLTVGWNK
jgi:hypothetical protein